MWSRMRVFSQGHAPGIGYLINPIARSGQDQLGVRNAATGNHGFVITEHHRTIDGDTEITEGETEINDLISGGTGSNELGRFSLDVEYHLPQA